MHIDAKKNQVSFVWELKNFPRYLNLCEEELESPPFSTKCSEIISWFLTIRVRNDVLDCFLYRLNRIDDLGDIYIEYKLFVIGEGGSTHFSKSGSSKLPMDVRCVEILEFLDTKQLLDHHMPNGILRLQLNLGIKINYNISTAWSFNEGLRRLSWDMLQLYETGEYSNRKIIVDNEDFDVHSFVIGARCPKLRLFYQKGIEMNHPPSSCPSSSLKKFKGIQSLMTLLKLPPHSNFVKRSIRLGYKKNESGVRFQEVFSWMVCDAFLQYLYSGQMRARPFCNLQLDDDLRFRLLIVARFLDSPDLVRRLQEVESKTTAITELVMDKTTADLDLKFLADVNAKHFAPFTRLVKLSSTKKRYVAITYSVSEENKNMLHISCELVDCLLPTTIKCETLVFNSENREYPQEKFEFTTTLCYHREKWCPPIRVMLDSNLRVRCIFNAYSEDKTEISRQEFSISPTSNLEPRSLRQLSYDFATALTKCTKGGDNIADMILATQRKDYRVHRHMVCIRVPKLRQKLTSTGKQCMRKFKAKIVLNLIEYIYTGMLLDKEAKRIRKLLEYAKKLKVRELVSACKAFLNSKKKLNARNQTSICIRNYV